MKDILVRKISEETYNQLREKAQASKEGALEPWLREQLNILAIGPVVKERYSIRIGGIGQIRRFSNALTSLTHKGVNEDELQVLEHAKLIVERNEPNDREDAIELLRDHFDDVFEVAV